MATVPIKTAEQLDKMRRAGRIVAETLQLLRSLVKPGVSTAELDRVAEAFIRGQGATPSFKGITGFRLDLCVGERRDSARHTIRPGIARG